MPELVTLKRDPFGWQKAGALYAVIGLETATEQIAAGYVLRSGIVVVRLEPDGEYRDMAFSRCDFTNVTAQELARLVADKVEVLKDERQVGNWVSGLT